jgi:transcriptional regulator with XRE-family HTH domain
MLPGTLLRQARERLGLTYRAVEIASFELASRRGSAEFIIHISRLAAIENEGTIPTPHRLYSLAAIYHLNFIDILNWYNVPVDCIFADGLEVSARYTHLASPPNSLRLPMRFDPAFDPRRTELLNRMVESWKEVEGILFYKNKGYLYGYVGSEDHMMEPMLRPGTLVLIDPMQRCIKNSGWNNEFERPIYFVDIRDGYRCSWCVQEPKSLILQPYSLSPCAPKAFRYPEEIDVVGRVVGSVSRVPLL